MKIRVLSFNIHKGFGYFNKSYNIDTIRELLEKWNPDIILLQELHGLHPENHQSSDSPLERLADSHWPFHQHGINSVYQSNFHGNAIISRFPIKSWENIDISTNPFEKRGLLTTSVLLPGDREIDIFCTHLNLLPPGQMIQSKKITNLLNQKKTNPMAILGGDFNDWSGVVRKSIKTQTNLLEIPRQKTYPSILPLLRLDNLFYRGLKLIEAKTIEDYRFCSDHLPILAVFDSN